MARKSGNAGGNRSEGGVRALERGLAVLAAMNRHKVASVVELAKETKLPRPTVYRLLETLGRAGFVTRSDSADRFCLARQVRTLSDGFVDDEWISEIAAPLMSEFTQEQVWPVSVMTFEEGRMLIRETTHPASTLSIDYGMVGRRLPLMRTAAGRVYLAFCPDNERRAIIDMLACSADPDDCFDARRLPALLKEIRARGHAFQDREINPRTSGLSVPICGKRLLGSVSMVWIASALTMADAEKRFVQPLSQLAERIAAQVDGEAINSAGFAAATATAPETASAVRAG
jgi:IclR family mhp operon transcriptional activator